MKKGKIEKSVRKHMDRISLLPIHSGNIERIENVKRVWIGKGLYKRPKIF